MVCEESLCVNMEVEMVPALNENSGWKIKVTSALNKDKGIMK